MRRTRAAAAETRQLILRTAGEMFVARGYDEVTLAEIARGCGLTRSGVQHHFATKGILFSVAMARVRV